MPSGERKLPRGRKKKSAPPKPHRLPAFGQEQQSCNTTLRDTFTSRTPQQAKSKKVKYPLLRYDNLLPFGFFRKLIHCAVTQRFSVREGQFCERGLFCARVVAYW
jgi:hypothetical protein